MPWPRGCTLRALHLPFTHFCSAVFSCHVPSSASPRPPTSQASAVPPLHASRSQLPVIQAYDIPCVRCPACLGSIQVTPCSCHCPFLGALPAGNMSVSHRTAEGRPNKGTNRTLTGRHLIHGWGSRGPRSHSSPHLQPLATLCLGLKLFQMLMRSRPSSLVPLAFSSSSYSTSVLFFGYMYFRPPPMIT